MRVVIQRVTTAKVEVDEVIVGKINQGFLLLLGVEPDDTSADIEWLANKCIQMRIFSDDEGKMNNSILDIGGSFLVVSQFTLHASTKKGNRPSFIKAARPEYAIPMYEEFCKYLHDKSGLTVEKGVFGADMQVSLLNDGPVTIIIDSKNRV